LNGLRRARDPTKQNKEARIWSHQYIRVFPFSAIGNHNSCLPAVAAQKARRACTDFFRLVLILSVPNYFLCNLPGEPSGLKEELI